VDKTKFTTLEVARTQTINQGKPPNGQGSDTKGKLNSDVNIPGHLYDLGKVYRLFGRLLQISHGKDPQARVVDL